jgi:hypothetical protein
MRSRQVDKQVRVTAGMLAGIIAARHLRRVVDEKIYWQYILTEFDEFKFFSLQARFLNGSLSEKDFRLQMGDSPDWQVSAAYVIGLKHWLNGDAASATRAFERCLQASSPSQFSNQYSPPKWAREDLQRLAIREPQNIE